MYKSTVILFILASLLSCNQKQELDTDVLLKMNEEKLRATLENMEQDGKMPRMITKGEKEWSKSGINNWTSGFFPGLLWQTYAYSGQKEWLTTAEKHTQSLESIKHLPWKTHDLGFMAFNSYGLGYKSTKNEQYKAILLETADSLATLFNPQVGTMLSWPWMKRKKGWPHNTIIDNMLNLELLFWASKNGGPKHYYDYAVTHAENTKKNHFRDDYSTYHVVVYDSISPKILKKITDQGFSDESVWARGQAWAIYGFTMCYRETGMEDFLITAQRSADYYIANLPEDHVPFWDFKDPSIPNSEKDASAGAIAASALLELSQLTKDKQLKANYFDAASNILYSLSSEDYISKNSNALLKHSVGNKPADSEIDVSLIYADYYFLEALLRRKELRDQYESLLKP